MPTGWTCHYIHYSHWFLCCTTHKIYESHTFVWAQDKWHPSIHCIIVFQFCIHIHRRILHSARTFHNTYILECTFLSSCQCHGSVYGNTITLSWLPLLVDSERKFPNSLICAWSHEWRVTGVLVGKGSWYNCTGQQCPRGGKMASKMNISDEEFDVIWSTNFKLLNEIDGN